MPKLVLGIPKGSLQESTVQMLLKAGYRVEVRLRSYYPAIDDEEIDARLIRPQDMPRFVEKGTVDAGVTGADWVAENESRVIAVAELVYAKQRLTPVRWVVAVPEDSPVKRVEDLQGKSISTELVNVTRKFLDAHGVKAPGRIAKTYPRKEHGLLPRREVEFVDQPDGVLVVKASKLSRGKRVVAALLRGGKVKGDTESWLRLTRGTA